MPEKHLKVYLITGEPSGDLLGARLMRALKEKGSVEFYGVGGEGMQAEGMESLFPISDLSVMGIFEVIPHLKQILSRIKQTLDDIEKQKPDMVIFLKQVL